MLVGAFFIFKSMVQIEKITAKDNSKLAQIIRSVMTEFGAVGEGTSILDPEVDNLFEYYSKAGHEFFKLITSNNELIGCGGIAPLKGGEETTCELRKMYFLPSARGQGLGKKFLQHCIQTAKTEGYKTMYLETLKSMEAANGLYHKFGFRELNCNLGNTGHFGCDTYYSLTL